MAKTPDDKLDDALRVTRRYWRDHPNDERAFAAYAKALLASIHRDDR